ncbi:sulfotransferase domain-containing protein [Rhodovulum bhavnagarense]|uniref:Sulfotransferase domain-containing protein n=1 Tax=Rhodovulum bhavnagarense TaxID=992286 RepID=A0A4R2R8Q7_9RHOB|nr:sulfotransferase domain-containing protein [Rhodovulum bhavnagarense]TCP58408.1 sulfotransferase domain-containing protein [Rhodovulum bhavnagarense]
MKAPNFFVLGAQKAGTTYLAKVLADHPEVFFTDPKETMFFSRQIEHSEESYAEYCTRYFGSAGDQPWRGEGSTTYLQWPHVCERMRRFVKGRPRFIVCLRQPTAKAVSFFIHNWRRDRYAPGTGLSDTMNLNVNLSPLLTSLYAESLVHWLDHYPREDFLFLKFDDLLANPAGFVALATDFLGIGPVDVVPRDQINAGLPLVWEDGVLTIPEGTSKGRPRPRFRREELDMYQEAFTADLRQTEALTGLDLSDWYRVPQLASRTFAP